MKILITGGSGFIGRALIHRLYQEHVFTVLTRHPKRAQKRIGVPVQSIDSIDQIEDIGEFDAIINLAGEPIADKRWTSKQKSRICHSRWDITQALVDKIAHTNAPPHTFISGSAIGYYGRQPATLTLDESHDDCFNEFSHEVCHTWEHIAMQAERFTRVIRLRTGIVLGEGGALKKMLPPFKLGLGGPIAKGHQIMSWIHIHDMVEAIVYLLNHHRCKGAYNLTAPHPVSNHAFSNTLAHVLGTRARLTTPEFVLRLLFGEMADLLVYGQKVVPGRLQQDGYAFKFAKLDAALEDLLT